MSDDLARETTEIESLLADRQRLNDWLSRLDGSDGAPTKVRDRVRADYEGRLAEVVARLRTFSATLTASLKELRNRRAELEGLRAETEEERAEATLRHSVGEYADDEWQRIDTQCGNRLEGFAKDIGELAAEIERLAEVLAQIAPPPPERKPSLRPVPVDDTAHDKERLEVEVLEPEQVSLEARGTGEGGEPMAVPAEDQSEELGKRSSEAPRFTPRSGDARRPAAGAARTLRFPTPPDGKTEVQADELTFLKSVALESPETEDPKPRSSAGRTLKCTECGSMNRPTEWYCERCGAELAAV